MSPPLFVYVLILLTQVPHHYILAVYVFFTV